MKNGRDGASTAALTVRDPRMHPGDEFFPIRASHWVRSNTRDGSGNGR